MGLYLACGEVARYSFLFLTESIMHKAPAFVEEPFDGDDIFKMTIANDFGWVIVDAPIDVVARELDGEVKAAALALLSEKLGTHGLTLSQTAMEIASFQLQLSKYKFFQSDKQIAVGEVCKNKSVLTMFYPEGVPSRLYIGITDGSICVNGGRRY